MGQLQDIVDQLDHPAGFYMDLPAELRHIRRLGDAGLNEFGITGNAGQGRFQLVADIGRKFLPHLLVVFAEQAVRVDALGKGNQLLVRHIFLDVFQIVRHLQNGLDEAPGQQTGHHGSCAHHYDAAQHDGRQGRIVDGPDGLGILRHTENVAIRQEHGVVIRLKPQRLGVAAVAADALLLGLLDLRAAQVVLHLLAGRGFEQDTAVRGNERDAQIAVDIGGELGRVVDLFTPGGNEAGLVFQRRPCLLPEGSVEYEDAEHGGADQPDKAHPEQPITDFFFHAPWFHSSFSSSLSASL